jgi:hypothetical protein
MSAACWADVAERSELRAMDVADRERWVFDAERAAVCTEIRALFVRAFDGEVVKLPRVKGTSQVVYSYTLADAIADVLCEGTGPAMTALTAWQKPGADDTFCKGSFREAVIDAYIDEVANDLTHVRLGWDR